MMNLRIGLLQVLFDDMQNIVRHRSILRFCCTLNAFQKLFWDTDADKWVSHTTSIKIATDSTGEQ